MLRLLDTLCLLLGPLASAWEQEFGSADAPVPTPAPAPLSPAEVAPDTADVRVIPAEAPAHPCQVCGAYIGWDAPSGVCSRGCLDRGQRVGPTEQVGTSRNNSPAPLTPEPLYVRRGAGKGSRYDVAEPGAEGQRYRLRHVAGRRKYTAVVEVTGTQTRWE